MSTIVVVKKNGLATIAADTLTTFGNTKESAEYIVNSEKIFEYQENYLGVTGSASLGIAVQDYLAKSKKKVPLASTTDIFRFGLRLHKELKENYYLRAEDDEDFETFRGDILIVNPRGIYGLSSYRYVQEFSKFYANGSGSVYALGALFVAYDNASLTGEEIARLGVLAGAEFDDASGLPMTSYTIKLNDAD